MFGPRIWLGAFICLTISIVNWSLIVFHEQKRINDDRNSLKNNLIWQLNSNGKLVLTTYFWIFSILSSIFAILIGAYIGYLITPK